MDKCNQRGGSNRPYQNPDQSNPFWVRAHLFEKGRDRGRVTSLGAWQFILVGPADVRRGDRCRAPRQPRLSVSENFSRFPAQAGEPAGSSFCATALYYFFIYARILGSVRGAATLGRLFRWYGGKRGGHCCNLFDSRVAEVRVASGQGYGKLVVFANDGGFRKAPSTAAFTIRAQSAGS